MLDVEQAEAAAGLSELSAR